MDETCLPPVGLKNPLGGRSWRQLFKIPAVLRAFSSRCSCPICTEVFKSGSIRMLSRTLREGRRSRRAARILCLFENRTRLPRVSSSSPSGRELPQQLKVSVVVPFPFSLEMLVFGQGCSSNSSVNKRTLGNFPLWENTKGRMPVVTSWCISRTYPFVST